MIFIAPCRAWNSLQDVAFASLKNSKVFEYERVFPPGGTRQPRDFKVSQKMFIPLCLLSIFSPLKSLYPKEVESQMFLRELFSPGHSFFPGAIVDRPAKVFLLATCNESDGSKTSSGWWVILLTSRKWGNKCEGVEMLLVVWFSWNFPLLPFL